MSGGGMNNFIEDEQVRGENSVLWVLERRGGGLLQLKGFEGSSLKLYI